MSKFLIYGLSNGIGGVEAIVLNMCRVLSENHSFDIILSEGDCTYGAIFKSFSNIRRVNVVSWGANRNQFRKDIKRILKDCHYDYVWFNGCIMSNIDLWILTKKYSNARTIAHSHGSSFEEKNKLKRLLLLVLHYANRHKFINLTDIPCMCSMKSGEWFYGSKFCCNFAVYMIKNGIIAKDFKYNNIVRQNYRFSLGINNHTYVLFHAGRLTHVKNQKFIIDIVQSLERLGKEFLFLLAGDGPLKSELVDYSNTLGLADKVCFLGNRSDVAQLYQAADCFILPSFHEGFPVTLIEAQASGLPCFVSTGITREVDVINSVHFLDIRKQTPNDWAMAIYKQSNQLIDRTLGYNSVCDNRFDIESVCEDFENHLMSV